MTLLGEVPGGELKVLATLVDRLGVRTVLEFGPGRSTELFAARCVQVDSFEHEPGWYRKMAARFATAENVTIKPFENRIRLSGDFRSHYDFGFVDAPRGRKSYSRLNTVKKALDCCDHVVLHDAWRQGERETAIMAKEFLGDDLRVEFIPSERGMYLFSRREHDAYPRDPDMVYSEGPVDAGEIPVWIYWETLPWRRRPAYLEICEILLRAFVRPPFRVRLVTREHLLEAFPAEARAGDDVARLPNRVSYYRMLLLQAFGGIYVDIDTLVFRPFTELWEEAMRHGFVCYGYDRSTPAPENGVIAATPGSGFVRACVAEQRQRIRRHYMAQSPPWFYLGREVIREVGVRHAYRMLPATKTYGRFKPEELQRLLAGSEPDLCRELLDSQWGLSLYNNYTVTEGRAILGELDVHWFENSDRTLAMAFRQARERASASE